MPVISQPSTGCSGVILNGQSRPACRDLSWAWAMTTSRQVRRHGDYASTGGRFLGRGIVDAQHGRFWEKSGHHELRSPCPPLTLSVGSPPQTAALRKVYSITSSAVASSEFGTAIPSVFAVLRLMTSSNLVGCTTGKSAGLSPLRILPA